MYLVLDMKHGDSPTDRTSHIRVYVAQFVTEERT